MKNRTLSAEQITSAPFLDLPAEQQVLYLSMLCHADDDGVMRNDITEITARCRPLTDRATVASNIGNLIDAGFVVPVGGYLAIAGFSLTQKVGKPRPRHFPEGKPKDIAKVVDREPDHRRQAPPVFQVKASRAPAPARETERITIEEPNQDLQPTVSYAAANADAIKNSIAPEPEIETVSREVWEARIENFRNRGAWLKHYGPKPGLPGCIVPEDLL